MGSTPADAETKDFTPRRGRPSPAQLRAIEHSILQVAQDLFLTNGYAHTTMEAVAVAAGVSKGTLYARYPDKTTLFSAIIAERLEFWGGRKTRAELFGSGSGTVSDHLNQFGVTFLDRMRVPEVAAFDRLLAAEALRFPELARELYLSGYAETIGQLAAQIRTDAVAEGKQIKDPTGVATAFIAMLIGWVRTERLIHELSDELCAAFVARSVAIFVGGQDSW